MPTLILRPVSDKSLTHNCSSGSSGSSLINESIADDDSSYIFQKVNSTSDVTSVSIFSLDDNIGANIKGKFKITSFKIYFRAKTTKSNDSDTAYVGVSWAVGENYDYANNIHTQPLQTNYSEYYSKYDTVNGIDINNRIFESLNDLNLTGIIVYTDGNKASSKNDTFEIRVTQVYLEITYEELENHSTGLYFKSNDSWIEAKFAYKKVSGTWVEQTDIVSLFADLSSGSSTNYVYGGSV